MSRQTGGSYKTVNDCTGMARQFVQHLRALNIEARKAEGISTCSLQKEMSAIRSVLHQAGRDRLADDGRLSNTSLGISGASRMGTKDPLPDTVYDRVYQSALERDAGLAATLQLHPLLGQRAKETVQAVK